MRPVPASDPPLLHSMRYLLERRLANIFVNVPGQLEIVWQRQIRGADPRARKTHQRSLHENLSSPLKEQKNNHHLKGQLEWSTVRSDSHMSYLSYDTVQGSLCGFSMSFFAIGLI